MTSTEAEQWRCPVCRQRLAVKEGEASRAQQEKHAKSQRHLEAASLLAMVDAQAPHA